MHQRLFLVTDVSAGTGCYEIWVHHCFAGENYFANFENHYYFFLLSKLGSKKYRLIMESLEMKYHYQAKDEVFATFTAGESWLQTSIFEPLKSADSILIRCEIMLYDKAKNHVATGYTNWQIKEWSKVKTKI